MRDAYVKVFITPDKMKASIFLTPPDDGRELKLEEILKALNDHGVKYGLDMETLENISKYPVYNENILVAEGVPACKW